MSISKRLHMAWRRLTSDNLSEEWWRQIERREQTQGWEGPVWRTPRQTRCVEHHNKQEIAVGRLPRPGDVIQLVTGEQSAPTWPGARRDADRNTTRRQIFP